MALDDPTARPGTLRWPNQLPAGFALRRAQRLRLPVAVPDKGYDNFHSPAVTALTARRAMVVYFPSPEAVAAGIKPDPDARWVAVTEYPPGTSCRIREATATSATPQVVNAPAEAGVLQLGPVTIRAYLDGFPYNRPIPLLDARGRSLSDFTCTAPR